MVPSGPHTEPERAEDGPEVVAREKEEMAVDADARGMIERGPFPADGEGGADERKQCGEGVGQTLGRNVLALRGKEGEGHRKDA